MMGVRRDIPPTDDDNDCRRIDTSIGWRNDDATGQQSSRSSIIEVLLLLQSKLLLLRDRETIIIMNDTQVDR